MSTGAGSKETESTEVKAEVVTEEEDASMDTPDPSEEIVGKISVKKFSRAEKAVEKIAWGRNWLGEFIII